LPVFDIIKHYQLLLAVSLTLMGTHDRPFLS
jgi:hypothetical protein